MAVCKENRQGNFTVMGVHHLRDKRLSLKAKGLLSLMLSLPENWNYSVTGLASIGKDGPDAVRAALQELEQAGYLRRQQKRDAKGKMAGTAFHIRELPAKKTPAPENPAPEKRAQSSIDKTSMKEKDNDSISYCAQKGKQSNGAFVFRFSEPVDEMQYAKAYHETCRQLEYEYLCVKHSTGIAQNICSLVAKILCSSQPFVWAAGCKRPMQEVRQRFSLLDATHVDYVLGCVNNVEGVRNQQAYLLTSLFNAPVTIEDYWQSKVDTDSCTETGLPAFRKEHSL